MSKADETLEYPCTPFAMNQRSSVVDGIDVVRVSVPWALDHVNCWLLDESGRSNSAGKGSVTLIDTGIDTSNTRTVWQEVLQNRVPYKTLITHYHPDHNGLAGWFHEQGSPCLGHADEIAVMHHIWDTDEAHYVSEFAQWYQRHGLDESRIQPLHRVGHGYRKTVASLPEAESWAQLKAGDVLELGGRSYKVLIGRGHAPAMVMLYCESDALLIAADQVLPRISPNVSVMPGSPDLNPLASFIDSLQELQSLPEDVLVLPSHGDPFIGLHPRVQTLLAHHQLRLDELRTCCTKSVQAADVLSTLFHRKLDDQQMSFALGEAVAHLRYLVHLGELVEAEEAAGTVFSPV